MYKPENKKQKPAQYRCTNPVTGHSRKTNLGQEKPIKSLSPQQTKSVVYSHKFSCYLTMASQSERDGALECPASQQPCNRFAKRKLISLEEDPPLPPPVLNILPPLNRLAYKLKPESAKTLKLMMFEEDCNWKVKVIYADGATGLLISLADYRSLADFQEWTTKNSFVRQLSTLAQLPCGEVANGSKIHVQAQSFMARLAADRRTTAEDVEIKTEDEASPFIKEYPHFLYLLKNGVFCDSCLISHTSVIPDDGF